MRLPVALLALIGWAVPGLAAEIRVIETPTPVTAITQTGDGVFVSVKGGSFRLAPCGKGDLCLDPMDIQGAPQRAPDGALPDGAVASATAGAIAKAWYGSPTDRYGHGVLGDAIEGGSLVVELRDGGKRELALPPTHVFEDLTPRLADLDGDGTREVVTIRSSLTRGAAVAIYGLRNGQLVELAASPEIGKAHRWLNIAAIVALDQSGASKAQTVFAVRTPHIGGILFSLDWNGTVLTMRDDLAGDASNHVIGSRTLTMGYGGQVRDGQGIDLVLPSQDRRRLRFVLSGNADIRLPGAIGHAIVRVGGQIVTATENGRLLAIRP